MHPCTARYDRRHSVTRHRPGVRGRVPLLEASDAAAHMTTLDARPRTPACGHGFLVRVMCASRTTRRMQNGRYGAIAGARSERNREVRHEVCQGGHDAKSDEAQT